MVQLPRNEKQTHQLNSRPQMWPSSLTLAMTLTLNFQGQIWNFLYLSQKWCNCHETKSKHIDWSHGLKCDQWVWPWPWSWPWIFKVKYGICYRSQPKVVWLPRNEKQTYRLNSRPQMWPMGLTLAMTLTFEFSRSNVILTIWWPRSGVRIYQIMTGVTSDVGVPSTHLVLVIGGGGTCCEIAFIWMLLDLIDKSALFQVMAWCHQATNHYLSIYVDRNHMSPYSVRRPQWINIQ